MYLRHIQYFNRFLQHTHLILCYSAREYAFLMLLLLSTTPRWTYAQQGVYFVEKSPVYVTYDSWIVTLTIDLHPFEDNIGVLKGELDSFYRSFHALVVARNSSQYLNWQLPTENEVKQIRKIHDDLLTLASDQVLHFNDEFQEVLASYSDLLTLAQPQQSGRKKRGVFPFVGKILNFLFSVPTESNLRELRRAISETRNVQSKIINVVENSLSIINTSHEQIQENREMITTLQNMTRIFRNEVEFFRGKLRFMSSEIFFLQMVTRLNNIFHSVYPMLMRAKFNMLETISQIQDCIQGNLPISLLPPIEMQTILDRIQAELPSALQLPHKLRFIETMSYYKFLHPLALPESRKIHILVAVPLISQKDTYRVFEAISLPFISPHLICLPNTKLNQTIWLFHLTE